MPEAEAVFQALVASGWGALLLWRVRRVEKKVETQNGTLGDHKNVVAVLKVNCAALQHVSKDDGC